MDSLDLLCYNLGSKKSVLASAQTPPGRCEQLVLATDRERDCTTRLFSLPVQRGYKVDNLISQGELFPEDSKFHSRHSLKLRHAAKATAAKSNGRKPVRPASDITGHRFGRLVATKETGGRAHGQHVWLCLCDCGHQIEATLSHLRRKKNPLDHCGCLGIDKGGNPKPGSRGIGGYNSKARAVTSNPTRAFNSLIARYRHAASIRGYEWLLTDQEFTDLIRGNCHYCGVEPRQEYKSRKHKLIYNGVDRVDSSKSYTPDNCVSCCGDCNKAKLDRSVDEFLAWIEKVHKHQHGA